MELIHVPHPIGKKELTVSFAKKIKKMQTLLLTRNKSPQGKKMVLHCDCSQSCISYISSIPPFFWFHDRGHND